MKYLFYAVYCYNGVMDPVPHPYFGFGCTPTTPTNSRIKERQNDFHYCFLTLMLTSTRLAARAV